MSDSPPRQDRVVKFAVQAGLGDCWRVVGGKSTIAIFRDKSDAEKWATLTATMQAVNKLIGEENHANMDE